MLGASSSGTLNEEILFGRYDYSWQGETLEVFVLDGQRSPIGQCGDRRCHVLSQSSKKEVAEALMISATVWSEKIHNEIWVYDHRWWSKDKKLWRGFRRQAEQT